MIKTTTIAITVVLAVLVIYLFPKQTISPGDLSGGHQKMESDCMKCHTMFLGTPGEKCIVCHRPAEIGVLTTAGVKIERISGQGKAAFHSLFSGYSCASCHKDHSGREMNRTRGKFSHDLLLGTNINGCRTCHKEPNNNMHRNNNKECNKCHTPDRWRPATLDHAKYFRFDRRHGPDCQICHRGNNYREYTCYGCHEHSPGKIGSEHLEESIRNYQDCAACHRSGNEDEAKRAIRSGMYQNRSWDRFEEKDYNRRGRYEDTGYDDDDDYGRHESDDSDDDRHDRYDDD